MGKKSRKFTENPVPWNDMKIIRRYCTATDCHDCSSMSGKCMTGDPKNWQYGKMGITEAKEQDIPVPEVEFRISLCHMKDFCLEQRKNGGCKGCHFNKDRKCQIGFPYISWLE